MRAPHNLAFESFPSVSDLLRLGLSSHKVPTPANKWIIFKMMNLKYILSLSCDWSGEIHVPVTSETWTVVRSPDCNRTTFLYFWSSKLFYQSCLGPKFISGPGDRSRFQSGYIDVGDGCWRRNVLVTVLAILVTNIHYLFTLASGTNIQKMSPTLSRQLPLVTNITLAARV